LFKHDLIGQFPDVFGAVHQLLFWELFLFHPSFPHQGASFGFSSNSPSMAKGIFQQAQRNQDCNGFYALVLIRQQSNDVSDVR
jgi:hypothetical protein